MRPNNAAADLKPQSETAAKVKVSRHLTQASNMVLVDTDSALLRLQR